MADMNTLLTALGDAVSADTDSQAYCTTTYGRGMTVYENCDARQAPPASACPLVILSPVAKRAGMAQPAKELLVGVSVVVHDEDTDTTDAGVVRYLGTRRAEELRKKILTALAGALPSGLHLMNADTDFNPIEQFPFVSADMVLEITGTRTIGQITYE